MKKVRIVAETGSDISPELSERYGICIVPMHVTFGDVTKPDGSFPPTEVIDYYRETGKVPNTSGSNVEDFVKVFDEIHENDPEAQILYMAYSSVTTCSYDNAVIAAKGRDYVTAVDTKQVSAGQCAAVIKTAQVIARHPEWEIGECAKAAEKISAQVHMGFMPENLDFLRAGGRVSNATALCGNLLNIHPCIDVKDGYLNAGKRYRGKFARVVPQLIREYTEKYNLHRGEVWLGHAPGFTDEWRELAEKTAREIGFEQIHWIEVGGVITSHGGPCAYTIAGYQGDPNL